MGVLEIIESSLLPFSRKTGSITDITSETSLTHEALTGKRWAVRVIAEGLSLNKRFYSADVLKKSVSLLTDAKVYAASGPDHDYWEKGVRSLVGYIDNPEFIEGIEVPGIYADLIIVDERLRSLLFNFEQEKTLAKFLGLSISAYLDYEIDRLAGIFNVISIEKYESVDIVQSPAAGGAFLKMKESIDRINLKNKKGNGSVMEKCEHGKEITEGKTAVDVCEECKKIEESKPSDEEIKKVLNFFGATSPEATPTPTPTPPSNESVNTELVNEAKKILEDNKKVLEDNKKVQESLRISNQKRLIGEAKLTKLATDQLTKLVESNQMSDEQLDILVNMEKDKAAEVKKGVVESLTSSGRLIITDSMDVKLKRVEAIFNKDKKAYIGEGDDKKAVRAYRNFSEAYCDWYEKSPVNVDRYTIANHMMRTFGFDQSNPEQMKRLGESLTRADLAEVMSQFMHKAMVENYETFPQYADWRKIAYIIPDVMDYQEHHRIKFGGYADLDKVGEAGVYPLLGNPSDEETKFVMEKRGGIASQITRESILNDNLNQLAKIPSELALAANRTLYRAVFNLLNSTTIVNDGNNNNNSASGLNASKLDEAILNMRNQTRYGTTDVLGQTNMPKFICVPNELMGVAQRLVMPTQQVLVHLANNNDEGFDAWRFRGSMEIIVVDDWTDADHWYLAGDPMQHEGIAIAFLNDQQNPEIFIQNDPIQGEAFSMDVQNVKVRHEWVRTVTDIRPYAGYRD